MKTFTKNDKQEYRVYFTNDEGDATIDFFRSSKNIIVARREIKKAVKTLYGGIVLSIEEWND